MTMVVKGKQWEINTLEEYTTAMEILDGNEFIANMSDDWRQAENELREIERQRREVQKQAKEKGIA